MVKGSIKKKKKVEHSKGQVILLIFAAIILIFYYMSGSPDNELLKPGKETSIITPSTSIPQETSIPEIEKPSLIKKTITETSTKETSELDPGFIPTKFINNLKCVDEQVTMTLGNYLNKEIKVSDLTFHSNGLLNTNPGCEVTVLKPGEMTFCDKVGRIKFRSQVRINIGYPGKYETGVVDCSKNKITANIVADVSNFFKWLFG